MVAIDGRVQHGVGRVLGWSEGDRNAGGLNGGEGVHVSGLI